MKKRKKGRNARTGQGTTKERQTENRYKER